MTKRIVTCVCAALAALLIVAAPAGASTKANIPFDFVVAGKTMPAGEYSFEMSAGKPVVAIQGARGDRALVFLTRQVGNYQQVLKPHFVFEKQGETYRLKEVWSTTARTQKGGK